MVADLKKTTLGEDGHYHIIYINDEGVAISSPDDKDTHIHTITPYQNPETGEIDYYVEEAEGHSHYIIDLELKEPKEDLVKGKDDKILHESAELLRSAMSQEYDFRERGRRCYDFYKGKQWDDSSKAILEASHRAAIVVNEIRPIIQVLSGHQRQNRTDIKTFPIEGADPRGAEIADILLKYTLEKANYAQNESNAFLDCLVTGRGLIDAFVDFSDNEEGDIKANKFKWDNIYFGPHDNEDLSDLEYLVKYKWFSLEKVKTLFKEKSNEIDINYSKEISEEGTIHRSDPGKEYQDRLHGYPLDYGSEICVDIAKKNVKLFELWRKRYRHEKILINTKDGNDFVYKNSVLLEPKDLILAKKINGMEIREVSDWTMEVICFIPNVVLMKRVSKLKDFNVVPFYASKEDGYTQGKVEPIIDLQMEINKRHSQAIDVVNRANNDIYYIDNDMFISDQEKNNFINNANTPGYVCELLDVNRKRPIKEERGRFPAELVNMRELASAKIKEISGVTQEVLGQESNARSGVAIARRLRQGLTVNDYLFDNLSIAKKRLGKILIIMIQNVYTVDRIMRILHNQNEVEPFKLMDANGEKTDFNKIDKELIRSFLENVDFTNYEVSISESANSPTKNLDRFTSLTELMANNSLNPISLKLAKDAGLISPSDAAELSSMLFDQQQSAASEKESDNRNQIARSLIGQGLNPDTLQPLPKNQ